MIGQQFILCGKCHCTLYLVTVIKTSSFMFMSVAISLNLDNCTAVYSYRLQRRRPRTKLNN